MSLEYTCMSHLNVEWWKSSPLFFIFAFAFGAFTLYVEKMCNAIYIITRTPCYECRVYKKFKSTRTNPPTFVPFFSFSLCLLRASLIQSRPSKVEVVSPFSIVSILNIITSGVLGKCVNPIWWPKVVVGINYLQVWEIRGLAKPFRREMSAPHLGGGVPTIGTRIHHLTSPFHHSCRVS